MSTSQWPMSHVMRGLLPPGRPGGTSRIGEDVIPLRVELAAPSMLGAMCVVVAGHEAARAVVSTAFLSPSEPGQGFRHGAPAHFPQQGHNAAVPSGVPRLSQQQGPGQPVCRLTVSVTAAATLVNSRRRSHKSGLRTSVVRAAINTRSKTTAVQPKVAEEGTEAELGISGDLSAALEQGPAAAAKHDLLPPVVPTDDKPPPARANPVPTASKDNGGDVWTAATRFATVTWDTFLDVAMNKGTGDSTKKEKFEYRKGLEGMSMGSMHYEMLTTSEGSDEFTELQREYKAGWGVSFIDLSMEKISASIQGVLTSMGLDGVYMTGVNLMQTIGLSGDLIDGIPVQNKWMDMVAEKLSLMSAGEDSQAGRRQMQNLMQNMVTGQMERIVGSPMPVFLEAYGSPCGVYKIVIGPRSVVVVSDPVILKHILQSSQEKYTKGILSEVLEPIMGKGLIPADFETWRVRRRAIVPGFHKTWLRETVDIMSGCAMTLCDDLDSLINTTPESSHRVNMEERFTSASLDIIGKSIFNFDFGSVERESPVVQAVYSVLREAERRAQSVIPYWNLPGAASVFRDQKSHQENLMLINAVLDELIRKNLASPVTEGHISMLQYLVSTRNEDVTNRQVRDDLMTLLIAGHETTAALLTWTLHELMKPKHANIMKELVQEVDSVLDGRRVSFDDVPQMPLLRACLLEALRLYPAPPLLIRRCVTGDTVPVGPTCEGVNGDTVSFLPGQDIFISTWSLQRNKELWGDNAAEFDPHRWERKIEGKGRWAGYNPEKVSMYPNEVASDFAFVPFGGGARKCIGDYFALLEAEVCLAALLQRFDFKAASDVDADLAEVGMTTGATIHTSSGLFVDVERRADAPTLKPPRPLTKAEPKLRMERKTTTTVAQRVLPEALVVPSAAELRELFTEQAMARLDLQKSPDEQAIENAYEKCREVTREHSKTFYLGSQLMDTKEQRVVWAIYNWCRATDELVDGPMAETTTMADLEEWELRLNRTFDLRESLLSDDWEELALADGIKNFKLIQRPFQDMIGGMAMDLVKTRYATFQELEVYCYRVAGTVGIMTLPVLGFDGLQNFTAELKEQTIAAAMSLGVAFQLTNILRDIGEDGRRGRIYVPLEDLERFHISEEELLEAAHKPGLLYHDARWKDFMEFQMDRCERCYDDAKRGIVGLSEVSRLGVMAAVNVYGGILDVIRRNNYDNLSRRAYVPLTEKFMQMGQAWLYCQELKETATENVRSGKIFDSGHAK